MPPSSGSKRKPSKKSESVPLFGAFFLLAACLIYSSTMSTEEVCSSETPGNFCKTLRSRVQEECTLQYKLKLNRPLLLNSKWKRGIHFLFRLALQRNSGLGRLHESSLFTSVIRSRTIGRTPWTDSLDGWSARRKVSTCTQIQKNVHTTQTLDIHYQSGIRTHDPGVRESEDSSCLRQFGSVY
jgi:hypothetical protein